MAPAKIHTIRLGPRGQALLNALTGATGYSQSEAVSEALEHWADSIADQLEGQTQDVPGDELGTHQEKIRTLRMALNMLGK